MQRKEAKLDVERPKSKRGRPRVGAEVMDSADRKRRWASQMRNEDQRVPGAPKRKAVQVYLSEDARAVFGKIRTLAKELDQPSISNSVLVEQLLQALDQRKPDLEDVGYSVEDVLAQFKRLKARVAVVEAQLRLHNEKPMRVSKRSLPKILEKLEAPPSREAIAMEIRRAHNRPGVRALEELAKDLRPLLASTKVDPDFHVKLRRRIEVYLERVVGLA
jgi:hypothetical protein